jgi:phosphohistidine phosphatase
MKRLTILRHAHASDAAPGSQDFERPLSVNGEAQACAAAAALSKVSPPDRLRVSPALRTRQTAMIVRELAFPGLEAQFAPELYLASCEKLVLEVATTPSSCDHLMLVGHNPGLSELAELWSSDPDFQGLSTAEWRSLELDIEHWGELAE